MSWSTPKISKIRNRLASWENHTAAIHILSRLTRTKAKDRVFKKTLQTSTVVQSVLAILGLYKRPEKTPERLPLIAAAASSRERLSCVTVLVTRVR